MDEDEEVLQTEREIAQLVESVRLAERERAALCCDDLAYAMENGAGDPEPGGRLRQAARNIREGKVPMRLDRFPREPHPPG